MDTSRRSADADWRSGCNELIFNPIITWWRKGPVTKQLRTFMWSRAPIHYKIGMLSCECPLSLAGWYVR